MGRLWKNRSFRHDIGVLSLVLVPVFVTGAFFTDDVFGEEGVVI